MEGVLSRRTRLGSILIRKAEHLEVLRTDGQCRASAFSHQLLRIVARAS